MNRRDRRVQGHRGAAQKLLGATGCPDCHSEVSIIEVEPHVFQGEVRHDDTCPWYLALQQAGFGIRFGNRPEGET